MAREDYTHKMVNGERVDLTSDEIDALVKAEEDWAAGAAARAWSSLRTERDGKLAATDWMSFPDSPTMSDAWKTYRQELRDLPGTLNDTTVQKIFRGVDGDIDWPTEPS